jgi:hypothetical protein
MVRYEVFKQLQELTSLHKTKRGFAKFLQTSQDYFDYEVGFLEAVVEKYKSAEGEAEWGVCFLLATIDDGGYVGRRPVKDEEVADKIVNEIADKILKELIILPPLVNLNILLRPYGIYVVNEG